jgi:hypothetical protein
MELHPLFTPGSGSLFQREFLSKIPVTKTRLNNNGSLFQVEFLWKIPFTKTRPTNVLFTKLLKTCLTCNRFYCRKWFVACRTSRSECSGNVERESGESEEHVQSTSKYFGTSYESTKYDIEAQVNSPGTVSTGMGKERNCIRHDPLPSIPWMIFRTSLRMSRKRMPFFYCADGNWLAWRSLIRRRHSRQRLWYVIG